MAHYAQKRNIFEKKIFDFSVKQLNRKKLGIKKLSGTARATVEQ